jgi:hypothetical protein
MNTGVHARDLTDERDGKYPGEPKTQLRCRPAVDYCNARPNDTITPNHARLRRIYQTARHAKLDVSAYTIRVAATIQFLTN